MSKRLRSWASVGATTLKPRLRSGSISPLRANSSNASRTGVVDTPSVVARLGTEYMLPGALWPEMISERTCWSTCSLRLPSICRSRVIMIASM